MVFGGIIGDSDRRVAHWQVTLKKFDIFTICKYSRIVKFEWDEKKSKANIKKHGIDFADVPSLFDHPMLINLDTRGDYGEDRWTGVGLLKNRVAVVVFTEREDETIRIISARKANQYEREGYEKEIPH